MEFYGETTIDIVLHRYISSVGRESKNLKIFTQKTEKKEKARYRGKKEASYFIECLQFDWDFATDKCLLYMANPL